MLFLQRNKFPGRGKHRIINELFKLEIEPAEADSSNIVIKIVGKFLD